MIKGELRGLFSRRGLMSIILIAFVLNIFVVAQGANSANEWGYALTDLSAAYQGLPEDETQILPWIEEKFETFAFSSFPERMLYTAIYERISAVVNYQENLQSRLDEAELMINSPFFVLPDTFGYRSLRTLQRVYGRLSEKNIQPTAGHALGIELATETRVTDVFIAFIALTFALGFITLPKEEGQFILLKPMKHGQGKLLAVKLGLFLFLLFLTTVLMYGTNLLIGHIQLGLGSMVRPVQSLYGFSTSRFAIDVWQYLILFIIHKFLWVSGLGCLFLCLCVCFRNTMNTCLAVAVVIGINIIFYQSTEPWILMSNFIWFSDAQWYFSGYFNLSFFGYPVDALVTGALMLCIISAVSYILAHKYFIREENMIIEKSIKQRWRIFPMHTNLMLHEGYKLFICQKGALLLIGFLVLQIYIGSTQNYRVDSFDRHYAQILAGFPSDEKDAFLLTENIRFNDITDRLNQYVQQLNDGNISIQTYQLLTAPLGTQLLAEPAFRRAEHQYAQVMMLAEQYSNIAFVELQVYEYVFGLSARSDTRAIIAKFAVFLALGLSAIFSVERSTHMDMLISISPYKSRANKYKFFWAGWFAFLATCIAFVPRIIIINMRIGYTYLNASTRSLLFMQSFLGDISILAQIVIMIAMWLLTSFAGVIVIAVISNKTKSRAVSALASCLLLIVLSIFIGIIANQI